MRPITDVERDKYTEMWTVPDYHVCSPALYWMDMFFQVAKPEFGQTVLDVGAGAGAGSRELKKRGLAVQAFDLTASAWKHDDIRLMVGSVWRDLPNVSPPYDFVFCSDMMEHLPTEFVALAVSEMLRVCGKAFMTVSFQQEFHGQFIGQHLHLTVKPFIWWRNIFRECGTVYEARDMIGDGLFLVGR